MMLVAEVCLKMRLKEIVMYILDKIQEANNDSLIMGSYAS